MARVDLSFIQRVTTHAQFDATACMNCGVCTAVCPMEIELLPRKLFRYVMLGLEERMLEHTESVYQCLLCKMCEANCTSCVRIADNVRLLRGYIAKEVFKL
jgi:heterodisulfide reductase subunit C